jgi:transcriptional regulator with XRE-family HTH domain
MDREDARQVYVKLGQTIRNLRKLAGKKQEELAQEIHLSRASIVNIEKGRHKPQLHVLYDLAIALNCQLTDLIPSFNEISEHLPRSLQSKLKQEEKQPVAQLISLAKKGGNL